MKKWDSVYTCVIIYTESFWSYKDFLPRSQVCPCYGTYTLYPSRESWFEDSIAFLFCKSVCVCERDREKEKERERERERQTERERQREREQCNYFCECLLQLFFNDLERNNTKHEMHAYLQSWLS